MSPTPTERTLINRRKAADRGDVLVPLLERLLENEVIPEDEEDFRFLDMLVRVRAIPRQSGVFSPSMLGSCMRQAWLSKRGTPKHRSQSPQMNGYFLKGNFIHFQWQFALWKAHRAKLLRLVPVLAENEEVEMFSGGLRPGVEVRVVDGEFGGTIDALVQIAKRNYVVDFKGINLVEFQRTVRRGASAQYRKQIVGYAKVVNRKLGLDITDCLLVSECKAGPLGGRGSPIALHETLVPVADFEGEVERRLKTLHWHDKRDEMPAPECVSTQHMRFQECPYGGRFCHDEVLAIQREREKQARKANTGKTLKPARPSK